MANYYSDHPEIGFYLNHPLMARLVELKEKGFADAKEYDYAPVDLGDAIENYKQILDITGDVAANIIEPNSEAVDLEGPHLENGRMIYASKTYENLDATRKAGLWGLAVESAHVTDRDGSTVTKRVSESNNHIADLSCSFGGERSYAAGGEGIVAEFVSGDGQNRQVTCCIGPEKLCFGFGPTLRADSLPGKPRPNLLKPKNPSFDKFHR